MIIELTDLGKRFNGTWIFRHLQYRFSSPKHYAVTGPNGSGKSTRLQVIAGTATCQAGSVRYRDGDRLLDPAQQYRYFSLAAPYLELVEEMTLAEFLSFHHSLKGWIDGRSDREIMAAVGLEASSGKQLRYFSSGMKQRVKLAQAIFSDVPVVLLDEPATNLDEDGVQLYRRFVQEHCRDRLTIISSNDTVEYDFCEEKIDLRNYK